MSQGNDDSMAPVIQQERLEVERSKGSDDRTAIYARTSSNRRPTVRLGNHPEHYRRGDPGTYEHRGQSG